MSEAWRELSISGCWRGRENEEKWNKGKDEEELEGDCDGERPMRVTRVR